MTKPTVLILAAGMGSRYGGLKQMDPVGPSGETILDYSVYDAIRAGFGKAVFVIRRDFEQEITSLFSGRFGDRIDIEFAIQELDKVPDGVTVPADRKKPWGTAHAVMIAGAKINEPFAVINADDFYGAGAFKAMGEFLVESGESFPNNYCMVGYELGRTLSDYGHVSRGVCRLDKTGLLASITELTQIVETSDGISYVSEKGRKLPLSGGETVSMNMWGLTPSVFEHLERMFVAFLKDNADNPKSEYYIPTAINELMTSGVATVRVLRSSDDWFGVTYKDDKATAEARVRELVEAGVYPSSLWE